MSFSEKESGEDVEALVDTLTIDANTLAENSISLSTSDLQQLAELSQELHLSTEMEAEGEVIIDSQGENMEIEEEIVETELGAEDIEIESEQPPSPEEILPDTKKTPSTTSVPPLRPLTIAPKPTKVPITIKPVAGSQQLLLVQGPNQTIKLLSPQGQELNVANVSLGRPLTIKPTVKTITNQGVPQKQILMKKMATSGQKITTKPLTAIANKQGQIMVVQKADPPQVKLVQSSTPLTQITSPTKTITLQQAQEMGLLTSAKLMPQAHSTPKQTVLLNKGQAKTIKLVPQMTPTQMVTSLGGNMKTISVTQAKQPTKILPANKLPQHIIFKKGTNTQTILPSAQLIQVAGNQALGATQLHQINIPGKGMQYIKFVPTPNADTSVSTATSATAAIKGSVAPSAANIVLAEIKPTSGTSNSNIAPKPIKPAIPGGKAVTIGTQVVMVPTYTVSQSQNVTHKVPIPKQPSSRHPPSESSRHSSSEPASLESNGIRPRKPCNCTKSQCLKLYCECFANGEFCYLCNCMNCYNNLEHEEHRQRAIRTCLDRNPHAFRPKIGKAKDLAGDLSIRKHTKGCNCKRSGCLKNYCECYEAKIACSSNCKCIGCRNIEESLEKKTLQGSPFNNGVRIIPIEKLATPESAIRPRRCSVANRQAISFITDEVIEATCQCLLTLYKSAEEKMEDPEETNKKILEEFGRCMTEIIDCTASTSV